MNYRTLSKTCGNCTFFVHDNPADTDGSCTYHCNGLKLNIPLNDTLGVCDFWEHERIDYEREK